MGKRGATGQGYPTFGKIPRLNRPVTITEKIDGTHGLIYVNSEGHPDVGHYPGCNLADHLGGAGYLAAGSRNRWLTEDTDNYGFAAFVRANAATLISDLGPGLHYGEWYGRGIQRGYGMGERAFALFNTRRWRSAWLDFTTPRLTCVPVLYEGTLMSDLDARVDSAIESLLAHGSRIAIGYPRPEGVVVYHHAAEVLFKVMIEGDGAPKSTAGLRQSDCVLVA